VIIYEYKTGSTKAGYIFQKYRTGFIKKKFYGIGEYKMEEE